MRYFENEEWRQVPGAREGVMLSNYGRPREGRKLLHTYDDKDGYLLCSFGGELGRKKIHQAMAITFADKLPNPDPSKYFFLDHIDGNPHNNKLENFRWSNPSENLKAAYEQGLIKPKRQGYIIAVNKDTKEGYIYRTITDCANDIGTTIALISNVLNGKTKTHKGYNFYKINSIKDNRAINKDGEVVMGVNYDEGNWAEYIKGDLSIKITDRSDKGYSQKELRDLVQKFADSI